MSAPMIGRLTLLVYRECAEGCWCATGENATAPLCATHGLPMLPGGGPEGMYDRPSLRRLGFAALFGHEQAMHRIKLTAEKWLGFYAGSDRDGFGIAHEVRPPDRYFHEREIAGFAEQIEV